MKTIVRRLWAALFFEPVDERLPERVRAQIARDQATSEVLIGWVQMTGILLFAALYFLAPRTFPEDAALEPVPWALGTYFLFTVLRLVLAHARRLPDWMIVASIVVDMTVLLVTIWSFHLQYEQPPGFSLKVPTMLYLFVLIVLRTLRFDPRYVLMAGVCATVGWLAMLVYALHLAPAPSTVTRDYVHYLYSSDILIGGEVDKILTFVLVTGILFITLTRARRQLFRSVAAGEAASDLTRFFSPEVVDRITHAENVASAGEGVLRDAAILFVDLRGFTSFSRRAGPDRTLALLSRYQGLVVPAAGAHGGTVDKFMGDGVMITFGATARSSTFAADALRAALDIDSRLAAWNGRRKDRGQRLLDWGMGLAAGTVIFGTVGDESRLEYTVIGEAVNLAAKLEKHCKAAGSRLVVAGDTLVLARQQGLTGGALERRAGEEVEGVPAPVDIAVPAREA